MDKLIDPPSDGPIAPPDGSDQTPGAELPFDLRDPLLPLLVAIITFVAFLPCLKNGFVDWDDDRLIVNNYDYRGLGPAQVRWMFTKRMMGHYQPLAWLTLGADYCLHGMNPWGYHLSSILIHSAGAAFVYLLALALLRAAEGPGASGAGGGLRLAAWFAALLYAVHPLRVESVAWVTERRDVVCMFFLAPAAWCYVRYASGRAGPASYTASIVLFGLSLLAKPWGMTLPIVLFVLDAYPLRRIDRWRDLFSPRGLRLLSEKLPFAMLAALAAMISLKAQSFATMESLHDHGPAQRIAQAAYGLCFYVWKTILPIGLSPLYEIPPKFDAFAPRYILCAVLVILLTAGLFALRRRWPAGLTTWLCYILIVAPVLGLAQTGPQFVADRYSYVACVPFAILAGACLVLVRKSFLVPALVRDSSPALVRESFLAPASALVRTTAAALLVLALAVLTWRQCAVWRDSVALWEQCLAVEPESWNGHNNLGVQCFLRGDYPRAITHLEKSLAINPANELGRVNLGSAHARMGRPDEALRHYREAARTRTRNAESLLHLANGLAALGRHDEAVPVLTDLIALDPENTDAQFALGTCLERQGRLREAIAQYERTLQVVDGIRGREGPLGPRSDALSQQAIALCAKLTDLFEQAGEREKARQYFTRMQGG